MMSKITESARNEDCQVRIPFGCCFDPATTVWAHADKPGKPKGGKLPDELGAYACWKCHAIYDRSMPIPKEANMTRVDVELAFWEGHARSIIILKKKGLL
ncbi:MAG: nuclease domain-containing protein [bacterium]